MPLQLRALPYTKLMRHERAKGPYTYSLIVRRESFPRIESQ
jgi:hypothetical protein